MARKKDSLDARSLAVEQILKGNYRKFLEERGWEPSPHYAHCYAIYETTQGQAFGYKERDLILLVEGALPEMYD